ncbi:MAG TPA: helix-turn-helix domain-containing protein [Novosphingobium sp.]|nr:helix-turn-helix domain-containing protein [Novosphingobium sp.]
MATQAIPLELCATGSARNGPSGADDDSDRDGDRGIPIRAISRAVAVLQAINRGGSLSISQVAQDAYVPYPTACRIIQTLLHEGLIEREPDRKRYRPTALVRTLSHGFDGQSQMVEASAPQIASLTRRHGWPVSVTTRVGSSMVLAASTHAQTSLTFNHYNPGYAIPILASAAGLVHLAFCPHDEAEAMLAQIARFGDAETLHMLQLAREGGLLQTVRANGYAARGYNRFTHNPGKTSSIAVPIMRGDAICGAMTMVFFASAIDMRAAVRTLLPDLRETAQAVSAMLEDSAPRMQLSNSKRPS